MRKTILPRLLLMAVGVLLIVLPILHPQLTTQSERTLNTNDKTDAFVPGDVLVQTFTVNSAPESIDIRLETAASASGKIELSISLMNDKTEYAAETISLDKKKAKTWLSVPVSTGAPSSGSYTLRIEVLGEGSVKLGGEASESPMTLNGEPTDVGLDLRIKTTIASHNAHLQLLGVALGLLAFIPIGGRRKQDA